MQYSIIIMRHTDDESTELFDQYITADQAIEALLFAQGLDQIEDVEEEEQAEAGEDVEVEEEAEPEQVIERKPKTQKASRTTYDKAALGADIKANVLTTSELASKYRVGTGTIYQARHALKHADPVTVADDAPAITAYAQKQVGRAEIPTPDVNIEGEIKLAAIQGFSVSEIADMYPTVPLEKIAKIKAEAKR